MEFFQNATDVYFNFLKDPISVSSIFCEFSFFGREMSVKWYGVIIAFGFTLAVLFGGRIAYVWRINLNKMIDVLIYGTIFGILGARLYYVISEWSYYSSNLSSVFKIWEGGLAIYGGIIGGLAAAFVTCRIEKVNFLNLLDLAGMSLLIGQGIGRWGNFANQEAFGTNTTASIGMWSEKIAAYISRNQSFFESHGFNMDPGTPVHPTFLYESVWCLLGFFVLYLILKKARKFSGQLFLCYGVWYGTGRMIIEGMRTDSLYIGNSDIRVSQAVSFALVIVCLVLLVVKLTKSIKHPKPIEGVDFFPEGSRIPKNQAVSKLSASKVKKDEAEVLSTVGSDGDIESDFTDSPETPETLNKGNQVSDEDDTDADIEADTDTDADSDGDSGTDADVDSDSDFDFDIDVDSND